MATWYVKAYYDWIEQTAALSDAERGRLFIAILEYARSGLEPKLDGRESILFPVFKSIIDRDAKTSTSRAESGSKGGNAKANAGKQKQTVANASKIPNRRQKTKTEDKDNDKDVGKGAKAPPPRFEDVLSYAEERGIPSLAKPFFDYFSAGDWIDSKGQPVRNWKQKFLTWESKEREKGAPSQPGKKPGYNVQHHDGDLSDLQKAAIQRMLGEEA